MTKTVEIDEEALEIMRDDALKSFPDECCGFFFGAEKDSRKITYAVPVINNKQGDKKRRFEISPIDYMRAEKYAIENGTTLLGIYHSHPLHPAIASEHDRVVALPWFSYVILSTFETHIADVKSWQLDDQRNFVEENIIHQLETQPNN